MGFEFGECHFNGIEIGAVRRQITQADPASRKQLADVLDFVGGEVVQDECIALMQFRTEYSLKISCEDLRIDWSCHQKGSGDAFMAQGRDESGTLPVTMGYRPQATLANGTATMDPRQFGVQTRLIDKHQTTDIPSGLLPAPKLASGFYIRTVLLGGANRFFYSSVPVAPNGAIGQ